MRRGLRMPCSLVMPDYLFGPYFLFGGLGLGNGDGSVGFTAHRRARSALHPLADYFRHGLINRAGMGLLLGDAELGQHVNDGVRGDLKLPGELIDSNFTHK
jgi:hypothetical protein